MAGPVWTCGSSSQSPNRQGPLSGNATDPKQDITMFSINVRPHDILTYPNLDQAFLVFPCSKIVLTFPAEETETDVNRYSLSGEFLWCALAKSPQPLQNSAPKSNLHEFPTMHCWIS